VYFDNDYPNPRSIRTTSDKTYDTTFERYIKRKEIFMDSYSASLSGKDKIFAKSKIRSFFDYEVQVGYDNLMEFSKALIPYLDSTTDIIEIELQAYASPVANMDYNKFLTSRRIDCVKNHFKEVNRGALLKYLENGRLYFIESAQGEMRTNASTSDKKSDRRASEFSPEASLERRVRIIDIRINSGDY